MTRTILCDNAYARGRMLEGGAWLEVLPRGIRPSDVDTVIDNNGVAELNNCIFDNNANGKQLWVEFSTKTASWDDLKQLSYAQYLIYRNYVARHPDQMAALCFIKPTQDKPICSRHDVLKFSLMIHDDGDVKHSTIFEGKNWTSAVKYLLGFAK